jgi:hypothetical protein
MTLARTWCTVTATVAVALSSVVATTATSHAASQADCEGGGFTVSQNGRSVTKLDNDKLAATSLLNVRGRYIEFDFAPVTGNIYDYTYTGAANAASMTPGVRTPIFASKSLSLGPVLRKDTEIRADRGDLVVISRGRAGKVKIQAKDCATGGLFQQETESETSTAPVTYTHTLAPGMSYFVNPYTTKINYGNGGNLLGKDSPQVATKVAQSETVAVWSVASGGRMGGVLGEDAVELSAGATSCVQDCQAQNRIRGSVDVTDPRFSS